MFRWNVVLQWPGKILGNMKAYILGTVEDKKVWKVRRNHSWTAAGLVRLKKELRYWNIWTWGRHQANSGVKYECRTDQRNKFCSFFVNSLGRIPGSSRHRSFVARYISLQTSQHTPPSSISSFLCQHKHSWWSSKSFIYFTTSHIISQLLNIPPPIVWPQSILHKSWPLTLWPSLYASCVLVHLLVRR